MRLQINELDGQLVDEGTLANSSFKELVVPSDLEFEVLLVALVFELSQTGDQDSLELRK